VHPVTLSHVATVHAVLTQDCVTPPAVHWPPTQVFGVVYTWKEQAPAWHWAPSAAVVHDDVLVDEAQTWQGLSGLAWPLE